MPSFRGIFLDSDSRLRYVWRAIVFYCVGTFVVFALLGWPIGWLAERLGIAPSLTPGFVALAGFRNFLVALICTATFAVYEHRRVDSYGLPIGKAFSRQTLEGLAAGLFMPAFVMVGMLALGGMQIHGMALHGGELVRYALAWLGATLVGGFAEEFWFRGYLQQTLWKAIGFWPSAVVIALIFTAEHYFFKEGENWRDVVSILSLSVLVSYSILRTGSLWFGVGSHFAFNAMQLFVIGTPNGARVPEGHLLNTTFFGPAWVTGGLTGTQSSLLLLPAVGCVFLYLRFRRSPVEPVNDSAQ